MSFLYFIMMNLFSQVKNLHNNHIVPLSAQTEIIPCKMQRRIFTWEIW